jgi:hypothetical protein
MVDIYHKNGTVTRPGQTGMYGVYVSVLLIYIILLDRLKESPDTVLNGCTTIKNF